MNLLKGSWVLKLLALVFAVATYFYIHHEIENREKKQTDPSYKLIKLTAKNLPIKVRLATSPPEGYRIVEEKLVKTPQQVVVVGPEALLEEVDTAETALVDVSENTKTVTKKIPLESVAGIHLSDTLYTVEVTVPIEKIDSSKP
jgi:YbbR domain-containing protein